MYHSTVNEIIIEVVVNLRSALGKEMFWGQIWNSNDVAVISDYSINHQNAELFWSDAI